MLDKFDPAIRSKFNGVKTRARTLGENLLKRQGLNHTRIVSELMNIEAFPVASPNDQRGASRTDGVESRTDASG